MAGAFAYGMVPANSPKGSAFQAVQPSVIPCGIIQMFAGATAPNGWLVCDGSTVSRKTYSDLFKVIGTTYGAGNSNDTFTLPDMRGRTPIGVGTGSGLTARTLGGTVGTETVTLDSTQIPAHSHPNTVSGGSTGAMSTNASHTHDMRMRADNSIVSGNYVLALTGTATTFNNTSTGGTNGGGAGVGDGKSVATNIDHTHTFTPSITNANNTGGGGSHSNIQPSIGLNFIIKT